MVPPWSARSSECRLPPPPAAAPCSRRCPIETACLPRSSLHPRHCCSTPLPDWDLPDDKPDFNTHTNDKLVQNDANQTLSAAGLCGAAVAGVWLFGSALQPGTARLKCRFCSVTLMACTARLTDRRD